MGTSCHRPMMIRAIVLLCLLTGSRATKVNYCDENLCPGAKHIACGHNGRFSSQCPAGAKILVMDMWDQLATKLAHNAVRHQWASGNGKVRVKACRMRTINWDAELARLAELNVKQCVMEHDDCHNTHNFSNSGQNLYTASYSGMGGPDLARLIREAVEDWAKEGEHMKSTYLEAYPDSYNGPTIGHFTAVVQEDNVAVGCAIANYQEDGFSTFLVACNYATTNIIGSPVYTSCSTAGEGCKTGINPKKTGLCSVGEDVDYT